MPLHQVRQGKLVYYRFTLFAGFPELVHGIFTRQGGVSSPPYNSLNLSLTVGDQPERVLYHRQLVREALGVSELVSVGQVHGKKALIISTLPPRVATRESQGIDILITNVPGVALMVKQADCQAVLFYDPQRRVIANVHCGWRGNVQNVLGQTVRLLQENFGSRPQDLHVGISPSLGPGCAEFVNYRQELPQEFWSYQTRPDYFDLWRLSRDQLQAQGVRPELIQLAGLCSCCQAADFFSYRRDRHTGRNATVIALRSADE
ncbi:MAG: peptidoglycan editing factor PgeF [Desulfobacca sp.]|nr:peptidoglycan editing factor PgeF [Desulfobacca sp.]